MAAARGWAWLTAGWRLFLKAPLPWIVMGVLYLAVGMALSLLPLVGPLVHLLLIPALTGGMIYAAAALDQHDRLEIAQLCQAFQEQERLGPLLSLGALLAGALLLTVMLIAMLTGGAMVGGSRLDETTLFGLAFGLGLLVVLALLLISTALLMALFYAVPLVMLDGREPWESLRDSLVVATVNVLPLSVFGLSYLLFALLVPLTLGLGILVLLPVTFGGIYASYREVFPGCGNLD